MAADVLRGLLTLLRIREANRKGVGIRDAVRRRTRRGQLEHIVLHRLIRNLNAGRARNRTEQHLHAPVLQVVVCIDRLLGIMLIVIKLNLDLIAVDTACRVNLIHRKLLCVLAGEAVNRRAAGHRADTADFPDRTLSARLALSFCLALAGCLALSALLLSASREAQNHRSSQNCR